jgi:hypothetical protein
MQGGRIPTLEGRAEGPGIPWLSDDANATRFPLTRKESVMSWQITRAKIIDEAEADENHIEFTRWQLYEFTVSAVELTFDEPLEERKAAA